MSSESESKFLGIEPLNMSKEDLEKLRVMMESKRTTEWSKKEKLRRAHGWCVVCGAICTQLAKYDYTGAIRIERYCDDCATKTFAREQVLG